MSKQVFPKFIQNIPHGIDKFEGGSADRVAEAIKNHIHTFKAGDKIPKIIGLDGLWGSGKSNVIKILGTKLKDSFNIFEYDAWGHQEDLQRRTFIETLTNELLNKKILKGTTTIKMKSGDTKNVTWDEKLKYLLARKFETETKSYPKIGYGIIVAFFTAILMPLFYFIASVNQIRSYWSVIVVAIPLIISFIIWMIAACKNKKYLNLDFLLAIYQDKVTEGVEFETISLDEPSVSDFRKWMQDVSKSIEGEKKLLIVFDNMDRLPTEKVKELWSSIHTFFAENDYPNIWVIIPYDKKHLANAFGGGEEAKNIEIICHFINKTFPVIYRIAPPVMTAWKKVFNEFYDDAFGTTENKDKVDIQRIFGLIKPDFTPRDIIAFINEMVSLKQTWKEDISLLHIAVFTLLKEQILISPVDSILSGNYLETIKKVVENSEELQEDIASLAYGIDKEIAKQIPLMKYLKDALNADVSKDINKYSDHNNFVEVLEAILDDVDIAILDNAINCLSKFNQEKIDITPLWNNIAKHNLRQTITKLSVETTHKTLLLNTEEHFKKNIVKDLCDKFRNFKDFKGDEFFFAMKSLEDCASEYEINIQDYIIEKKVKPDVFIEYANQANEKYLDYKLVCDSKELNEYLIGLIPTELPLMDFISYLIDDKSYSFDLLESKIEFIISADEININNFPELIKAYKSISKKKPLKQQFSPALITSLLNSTVDKTSDSYYDLVAMELTNQLIDTPYIEALDVKIAERLEYYKSYVELLILSKDWGSDLLRRSVKIMVEKSYGKAIDLVTILPFFEEIKTTLNIDSELLLNDFNRLKDNLDNITIENIETVIPKFSFYEYSSITSNELTKYINDVALSKIKTITVEELNLQRDTASYYWLNCLSLLIKGNILKTLPENITLFCKSILEDIALGNQPIPVKGSLLDTVISIVSQTKLQPTIKTICDDFCNRTKTIDPPLFIYFAQNFDFINKMNSRYGDISRNILNPIITDSSCLAFILENGKGYIDTINNAGADAGDLKTSILQLLSTNKSDKLLEFASAIGIKTEEDEKEKK